MSVSLQAQQTQATQPAQDPAGLSTRADSAQYILGAYLGLYMNAQGLYVTNPDMFLKGMDDALARKELLVSADSINIFMNQYIDISVMEKNRALEEELSQASGR